MVIRVVSQRFATKSLYSNGIIINLLNTMPNLRRITLKLGNFKYYNYNRRKRNNYFKNVSYTLYVRFGIGFIQLGLKIFAYIPNGVIILNVFNMVKTYCDIVLFCFPSQWRFIVQLKNLSSVTGRYTQYQLCILIYARVRAFSLPFFKHVWANDCRKISQKLYFAYL